MVEQSGETPRTAVEIEDGGESTSHEQTNEDSPMLPDNKDSLPLVKIEGGKQVADDVEKPDSDEDDSEVSTKQKEKKKSTPSELPCLTKEELQQFAEDPFWKRLRLILFILFWLVWVAMLAAVVIIIVVAPKCPPRPPRQFWQKPFYRLSVRSFAPTFDNDTSAPGTVEGLGKRMDYLRKTLGFDNFILDSMVSRVAVTGCASDLKAPNTSLASLVALKALTKLGRKKGFSFLMEFDASQVDISWWPKGGEQRFNGQKSPLASRYGDGQAFRLDRLHLPQSLCPSLNVSSPTVLSNIEEALNFWLDAGLSGFVLTNVAFIAPSSDGSVSSSDRWFSSDPSALLFSNDSVEFVRTVRRFINTQAEARGRELALFVSPGDTGFPAPTARLTAYLDPKEGAHAVVSVGLGKSTDPRATVTEAGQTRRQLIQTTLDTVSGNGSVLFATAGVGLRRAESTAESAILPALSLLLPGVPNIFYGQELGMAHVPTADNAESPMQWSENPNNVGWLANATAALTWANLTARRADIELHNRRRLTSAGHPASQLQLVADILKQLSSCESLQWGSLEFIDVAGGSGDDLMAFRRAAVRFPPAVVVTNTGAKPATLDLSTAGVKTATLKVLHIAAGRAFSSYEVDQDYAMDKVFAPAGSLLLFLGKAEE